MSKPKSNKWHYLEPPMHSKADEKLEDLHQSTYLQKHEDMDSRKLIEENISSGEKKGRHSLGMW